MSRGVIFRILGVSLPIAIIALIYFAPVFAGTLYSIVAALAPLWLPIVLLALAWPLWITVTRSWYVSRIPYATLELKPGDNTSKSAKAMELVFYALYYRTDITLMSTLVRGVVRVPWSFELSASGGVVRFFLHIPVHHRAMVEGKLRAEYRDIDIDEVRDYSREESFSIFTHRAHMREYTLGKADPYPLVTYETYEHAKDRRDVFLELLEEIGTVGANERIWVSLMVRPHQRDWSGRLMDYINPPTDTLHEDAHEAIRAIVGSSGDLRGLPTQKQQLVSRIESALQKPSFDCGIRVLYSAPREHYLEERAGSLDRLFDRFGDPTYNHFVSYDPRARVGWPLSDIFAALPALDMEYFLKLYRRRAFFAPPYYGESFVLNTEELATLFHIPKVGRASALSRSRGRLEPPDNLPV